MPYRISDPDSLAAALKSLERRVAALEQAPVVLGAYRVIQRPDGTLVARHQTTGHETVIGSPT